MCTGEKTVCVLSRCSSFQSSSKMFMLAYLLIPNWPYSKISVDCLKCIQHFLSAFDIKSDTFLICLIVFWCELVLCVFRELKDNLGSDEPEGDAPLLLQTMLARNPGIFREKSMGAITCCTLSRYVTNMRKKNQALCIFFFYKGYSFQFSILFLNRCHAAANGTTF